MRGLRKKDEEEGKDIIERPRCGYENPLNGKLCPKCEMALDSKATTEAGEKREEMDEVMTRLMKDPEVKEL